MVMVMVMVSGLGLGSGVKVRRRYLERRKCCVRVGEVVVGKLAPVLRLEQGSARRPPLIRLVEKRPDRTAGKGNPAVQVG